MTKNKMFKDKKRDLWTIILLLIVEVIGIIGVFVGITKWDGVYTSFGVFVILYAWIEYKTSHLWRSQK